MNRDLVEAHNRFSNAESVTITTQWISWPEYEVFVERLISFAKLSDGSVLDQKTRAELQSFWDLRRMLRGHNNDPLETYYTTFHQVKVREQLLLLCSRILRSFS